MADVDSPTGVGVPLPVAITGFLDHVRAGKPSRQGIGREPHPRQR